MSVTWFRGPETATRLRKNSASFTRERDVLDGLQLAIKSSRPSTSSSDWIATTRYVSLSQVGLGIRTVMPLLSSSN
ncbi:hypothetical protein F5X96DRAFT_658935, partial [Biscogniauxia mediterranea]